MKYAAFQSIIPERFNAQNDIDFIKVGSAIDIRLTRPQALNALTHQMILALYAGMKEWAEDDSVSHIVISANPGEKRAFCAGGDIRDIYTGFETGSPRYDFFRDEYWLNDAIATFPKPYIALMDGLVMGGGAGISIHGSHRVVTENTLFGMPEAGIGLIPDVGATFVLPRMKSNYGLFLGLTGVSIGPEECLEAGIGTHFCNASQMDDLRTQLLETNEPDVLLQSLRQTPMPNLLDQNAKQIDTIFSQDQLPGALVQFERLAEANPFLSKGLIKLKAASPLSICLAFIQLKSGAKLTLREGLGLEFLIVSQILNGHDLYEGIKATLIDRSTPARWQHQSIEAVDNSLIESFLKPVPQGILIFENE